MTQPVSVSPRSDGREVEAVALRKIERIALTATDWNKRTGHGNGASHNAFAEIIQTARAALEAMRAHAITQEEVDRDPR